MTMDWTDDQIFNDLEPFGGGGRKNQNPVPEESGSMDYIEELDRLLGPDVWRENFPAEFRNLGKPDAGTMVSRQPRLEPETGNESEAEAAPEAFAELAAPPVAAPVPPRTLRARPPLMLPPGAQPPVAPRALPSPPVMRPAAA